MQEYRSKILFLFLFSFFLLPLIFYPPIPLLEKLSFIFNGCYNMFVLPKLTYLRLLILISILVYIVRFLFLDRVRINRCLLYLPLLFFLIVNIISVIFSIHKPTSIQEFLNILLFLCFFFLLVNNFGKQDLIKAVNILIGVTIVVAIYAILQRLSIDFVQWANRSVFVRPVSTLGNPTFLAAYIVCILPMSLFLIIHSDGLRKYFYFFATILFFIVLLLTYARGSWLATFVSLIILLVCSSKSQLKKNKIILVILFVIFGSTILLLNRTYIPIEQEKKVNIVKRVDIRTASVSVRKHLWQDSLHMIRDYLLTGCGIGNYSSAYPSYRSVEILRLQAVTALPEGAHNKFLQSCCVGGLFTLFTYLWIIIIFVWCALQRQQRKEYTFIIASFSAYIIQSLFNPDIIDTTFVFYFLLAALCIIRHNDTFYIISLSKYRTVRILLVTVIIFLLMVSFTPKVGKSFLADIRFKIGEIYFMENKFEQALINYYLAIDYHPSSPEYHSAIGLICRRAAENAADKKKAEIFLKESIKAYNTAIKLKRLDASLYSQLAKVYEVYAKKIDKKYYTDAIRYHKEAIRLDKKYAIFHHNLAVTYLNKGDFDNAYKEFMIAINLVPNNRDFYDPYLNLGILYYKKGDIDNAIKYTKKAVSLEKNLIEGYANLAMYYKEKGNKPQAIKFAKKALSLNKKSVALKRLLEEVKNM